MKVGCYFARSIAWWCGALMVLLSALAWAWSAALPLPRAGVPAPWALVGPVFFAACAITWAQAARRGELLALAASGVAPRAVMAPVAVLGCGLLLLFSLPAGEPPATRVTPSGVQRSITGDLFLVHRGRGVLLSAGGALRLTTPDRPVGFRPAPYDPARYRRQAFFMLAPRIGGRDRWDPWLLRLLYALGVVLVPAALMAARRGSTWWWGGAPFALLIALL